MEKRNGTTNRSKNRTKRARNSTRAAVAGGEEERGTRRRGRWEHAGEDRGVQGKAPTRETGGQEKVLFVIMLFVGMPPLRSTLSYLGFFPIIVLFGNSSFVACRVPLGASQTSFSSGYSIEGRDVCFTLNDDILLNNYRPDKEILNLYPSSLAPGSFDLYRWEPLTRFVIRRFRGQFGKFVMENGFQVHGDQEDPLFLAH
jgi:hypothetical protein